MKDGVLLMLRVNQLIKNINLAAGEGIMVHNPSNMFYLANYRGEGFLLITNHGCAVVTDSRYTEQAQQEAQGFEVFTTSNQTSHAALAYSFLTAKGISSLYYEDDFLTVQAFAGYQKHFAGLSFSPINAAITDLRQIKDQGEIDKIKQACAITSKAFDYIITQVKEGITEKELALELEYYMLTHGATGIAFDTIIASGENSSLPHAIPGNRKITSGDMITFDFGAKVDGYCSDMTRTIAFGTPSAQLQEIYFIVLKAQEMAEAALAPQVSCKEIDGIARNYIAEKGYGQYFGHGLGHSLGIDIHESPRLSFASDAFTNVNQLLTVEPGIYLPGLGGVRIENTCLITQTGSIPLTIAPKELIIL